MPQALRTVWIMLLHLRLSSRRLDRSLSGLGECGSHNCDFLCQFSTEQPDNPQTRGKVAQIGYLLRVDKMN